LAKDESPHAGVTIEKLADLRSAFKKVGAA
jgi:hypothetical protein